MKFAQSLLSISAAAFLFAACNSVDFKKTSAGVPYKVFSSSGKADSVKTNYFVKYEVIQKVKDSVMYSSYGLKTPEYVQVQPPLNAVNYSDIRNNVMEILGKVKKGDSIYIVQVADSLIAQNPQQTTFKKGEEIVTTIRVVDVFKTMDEANAAYMKDNEPRMKEAIANAEKQDQANLQKFKSDTAMQQQMAKDNKMIEDYLAAHNIQAQKTEWGVYVQMMNPGQGPKPTMGKFVNIKYSGMVLNGSAPFDSGEFPLQIGTPGSIKGFEEGVKQLAKGGKARIFIPSALGYGSQGREPKIKPNQNLVFDIEILDISDTPPQQPQPAQPQGRPAQ